MSLLPIADNRHRLVTLSDFASPFPFAIWVGFSRNARVITAVSRAADANVYGVMSWRNSRMLMPDAVNQVQVLRVADGREHAAPGSPPPS